MTKTITVIYSNGEVEVKHVIRWVKDKYGVTYFLMPSGMWEWSYLVREVVNYFR